VCIECMWSCKYMLSHVRTSHNVYAVCTLHMAGGRVYRHCEELMCSRKLSNSQHIEVRVDGTVSQKCLEIGLGL